MLTEQQFHEVTGIGPDLFQQLDEGDRREYLQAVGDALEAAANPEEAEMLVSEAIQRIAENRIETVRFVLQFLAPPGEEDSVVSLQEKLKQPGAEKALLLAKLESLKKRIGLTENSPVAVVA